MQGISKRYSKPASRRKQLKRNDMPSSYLWLKDHKTAIIIIWFFIVVVVISAIFALIYVTGPTCDKPPQPKVTPINK